MRQVCESSRCWSDLVVVKHDVMCMCRRKEHLEPDQRGDALFIKRYMFLCILFFFFCLKLSFV